ncbi:hypothetical protein ACJX0J_017652, partial [Zea mays]
PQKHDLTMFSNTPAEGTFVICCCLYNNHVIFRGFYNEDDWYEDFHHGNFAFDDAFIPVYPGPRRIPSGAITLNNYGESKCLLSSFNFLIYDGKEDLRIIKNLEKLIRGGLDIDIRRLHKK